MPLPNHEALLSSKQLDARIASHVSDSQPASLRMLDTWAGARSDTQPSRFGALLLHAPTL